MRSTLRPVIGPVLHRTLHSQSPFGRRLAGLDVDELMAPGDDAPGGTTTDARRTRAAAGRALAGPRRSVARLRRHLPAPAGTDDAARHLGPERTGRLHHRRALARPAARILDRTRRDGPSLPGGVRAGAARGRAELVRPRRRAARCSNGSGRGSGRSATNAGASCSTCRARRCPIPRRRRRSGSCPSTTTSCSGTRTAAGSWRRTCPAGPTSVGAPCSSTATRRRDGGWSPRTGGATLRIERFRSLRAAERTEVAEEATRLLAFLATDAEPRAVRVSSYA